MGDTDIEGTITRNIIKKIGDYFKNQTSFVARPDVEDKNPKIYQLHLILHYVSYWIMGAIGLGTYFVSIGLFR